MGRTYADRIVGLERVRAGDLIAHEANWRQHPDSQVAALRGVLSEVGWSSALLAYRSNGALRLIDGHLRAGLDADEQVPVLVLDVDDAEAEKLLLSMDPLAAMAQADSEALRSLLERVETSDAGLGALLADLNAQAAPKQGRTDPDGVPEDVETRTKPGDLWLLGEHRLLCGDATSSEDMARVMGGSEAEMVFTDPPYGVDYVGGSKVRPAIENDHEPGLVEILREAFVLALNHQSPGGAWYVTAPAAPFHASFMQLLIDLGVYRQTIIWVKDNATFSPLGQSYHYRHEPVLYGWAPGAVKRWHADRTQDTIWEVNRPARSDEHPTMKPVELVLRALEHSSRHGDRVLDPFVGSGTTLLASEQIGRCCFAMDIEPHYCDVVVARWEAFTGQKAQLA